MEHPDRFGVYQGQVQTYAAFPGFMAGVVMFFTGIILTQYSNYDASIRVAIAFLLISIFGFLYGALVYTNAAEEVSNYDEAGFRRAIFLGDTISEYLGVYLLVIGIPLIINIVTDDLFLQVVTLLASLLGLAVYQFSRFSIVARHFPRAYRAVAALILLLGVLLFWSQRVDGTLFAAAAAVFVLTILVLTCLAARNRPSAAL